MTVHILYKLIIILMLMNLLAGLLTLENFSANLIRTDNFTDMFSDILIYICKYNYIELIVCFDQSAPDNSAFCTNGIIN